MQSEAVEKGVVLTIVITVLMMLLFLAGTALTLTYNYRHLIGKLSGSYIRAYFRAQAGVVDARWRIRNGDRGLDVNPGMSLTYFIDLDSDTDSSIKRSEDDVQITIGPVDLNPASRTYKTRPIDAIGYE